MTDEPGDTMHKVPVRKNTDEGILIKRQNAEFIAHVIYMMTKVVYLPLSVTA